MKRLIIIATLSIGQLTYAQANNPLKCSPSNGQVVFEAVGKPSMLKIKGTGEGPQGEVRIGATVKGDFKFKLETLKTGMGLRDDHMKNKYLQIAQFPTAELKIESVEKFSAAQPEGKGLPFKGTLTVHGVPKPVAGTVDVSKKGNGYKIKANFETKVTDHSIEIPSYLGVTVADAVKISVETDLM